MPNRFNLTLLIMGIAVIGQAVPQEVSMPDEARLAVDTVAGESRPMDLAAGDSAAGHSAAGDFEIGDTLPSIGSGNARTDTLELPQKTAKPSRKDSISREFRKYWAELEKREGIDELQKQLRASTDIDNTWVPRLYFFDSNLVVFPGWFVIRKREKSRRSRPAIVRPRDAEVSR